MVTLNKALSPTPDEPRLRSFVGLLLLIVVLFLHQAAVTGLSGLTHVWEYGSAVLDSQLTGQVSAECSTAASRGRSLRAVTAAECYLIGSTSAGEDLSLTEAFISNFAAPSIIPRVNKL